MKRWRKSSKVENVALACSRHFVTFSLTPRVMGKERKVGLNYLFLSKRDIVKQKPRELCVIFQSKPRVIQRLSAPLSFAVESGT